VLPSDYEPLFPPPNEKVEAAVGRFIITCGVLESWLDTGVETLFFIDPHLSDCITANLGTKAKIDMLKSGIGMHEDLLEPGTIKAARDALTLAGTLSGRYRNTLAHGQPTIVVEEPGVLERPSGPWHWARTTAREYLESIGGPMTAKAWHSASNEVVGVVQQWHEALQAIRRELELIDPQVRANSYSWPYESR
jgi:hypothetical protein